MAKLAAVVLAAGASRRFGAGNKLLAPIGGRPLVRCAAEEALAAGMVQVVVVAGYDALRIKAALADLPVGFAANAEWRSGMGSSVAAGVKALGEDIEAAFVIPADMPFLGAGLLYSLASLFEREGGRSIIYPATSDGEQRNPVLWPHRFFPALTALSGQEGAKRLLQSLMGEAAAMAVPDSSVFADIDTRAELEAAQRI
jgi:molybdenum cofactor cytidylyltransferase